MASTTNVLEYSTQDFLDVSRNSFVGSLDSTCGNRSIPITNDPTSDQDYAQNRIVLSDCAGEVSCSSDCCSDCFDPYGVSLNNFCDQQGLENVVNQLCKIFSFQLEDGVVMNENIVVGYQNSTGSSFGKIH